MPKTNLLNLTPADATAVLEAFFRDRGEPLYRARQVARRLWQAPARSFAEITELPAALRASLAEHFTIPRLERVTQQQSVDGTQKFLFRLPDGQAIETVMIPDGSRATLCISSQAGCALQCAFCATGRMGFQRNLATWEIAAQVREMRLLDPPVPVTNVVFMGMGEPLMNWKAVDQSLTILNSPDGLGIGARHITVSTVGVLPGIVALGERPEQFRLAISIHAPSDALRQELMPINTKYPLAAVIDAAKKFDRRVTFEYVMLGGVNDATEHAIQLARLAKECRAFVNLIARAVTAPFSLLASAFGGSGGEELGYIEFDPGTSDISQASAAKLDKLATALKDRPALKVDIIGRVDPEFDRDGLRREAVNRQIREQKLKDAGDAAEADTTVKPEEENKYLERAYKAAKFPKPRNVIGLAKSLPPDEMRKLMETNVQVTDADLRELAQRRANAVHVALAERVEPGRLFVVAPKLSADGIKDKGKTTRVDFALK